MKSRTYVAVGLALSVAGLDLSVAKAACQGGSPPADCSQEPPCIAETLYFGDGSDGDLVVGTGVTQTLTPTVTVPTEALVAGSSVLAVASSTGFAAGDAVLVMDVQGSNNAGSYEVVRLAAVATGVLTTAAPLQRSYPATDRVIVQRVFEYANLTIQAGGVLTGTAWNGSTGGVLAVFVQGTLSVNGTVDMNGKGFRGGAGTSGTIAAFGQDGEGWLTGPKTDDLVSNAGGGGGGHHQPGIHSGGGGGGAHAVAGIDGQQDQPGGGGLGAHPYAGTSSQRLFMGGGGGGGSDTHATAGGGGGGIVVIRAASQGAMGGFMLANGLSGGNICVGSGDAGGGGAGGTIMVVVPGALPGGMFAAGGGLGGTSCATGAGGNGGFGRVLPLAPPALCIADGDGDGIPDDIDACPEEHPGELDLDGDGCVDDLDADGEADDADSCWGRDADANRSGASNVADSLCLILAVLWHDAGAHPALAPSCLGGDGVRADINCDGAVSIGDVQLSVFFALDISLAPAVDGDVDGCPDTCRMPYEHSIVVDTSDDFHGSEALPTNTTGFEHFIAWDAANLYLGFRQPTPIPANSNQYWRVWYIGGQPGTTDGVLFDTQQPVLPFSARWQLQWRVDGVEMYLREWTGSAWGSPQDLTAAGAFSPAYGEVALPLATLQLDRFVDVHIGVIREEALHEKTFATSPPESVVVPGADPLQALYDPNYAYWLRFDRIRPPFLRQTPYNHTIQVDTANDFVAAESLGSNTTGWNHYAAWNEDTLYLGYDQPFASSTDWRVWYIGGQPGTGAGLPYNTQAASLPFAARWQLQWRTSSATDVFLREWNGTSWGASANVSAQAAYGAAHGEIGLSRTSLGIDDASILLHVAVVREQSGNERTFAGTPAATFAVPGGDFANAPYDPDYGWGLELGGGEAYTKGLVSP